MTNTQEDFINESTPLREDRNFVYPQTNSINRNSNNSAQNNNNNNLITTTEIVVNSNSGIGDQVNCNNNHHNIQIINVDNRIYTKMDDSKKVLMKIATDLIILMCVGFPILFYFLWGDPYKRGFFCDDESLMHPFHDSTVKNYMLYIVGLALPIALIILIEYLHARSSSGRNYNPIVLYKYELPRWMVQAYKQIGVFGFGAACSQLTTDIAKYSIGRLRPHFFSVCNPIMNGLNCTEHLQKFGSTYIEDFDCNTNGQTARILKEVRLSFPSGHSSFSWYTMVYCVIYLQCRMTWNWSKLPKHLLQFLLLMMCWYTALTRISDYKHHWSDVLAGAVLGITVSLIVSTGISDLFTARKRHLLPTSGQLSTPIATTNNTTGRYEMGNQTSTNGRV